MLRTSEVCECPVERAISKVSLLGEDDYDLRNWAPTASNLLYMRR